MASVPAIPADQQDGDLIPPKVLSRALEAAWRRGSLSKPTLDPDILIAAAERAEGAAIVGGPWRDGLQLLASDLAGAAELNSLGRAIAHGQLMRILRQRARAGAILERDDGHDSILERPVIVLGQMRSGTTFLHRLLACDERFSFTRLHETLTPVPRSRIRSVASAALVQLLLRSCNPRLRSIHPTSPNAAEEEFGLHAISFHGAMFEAQWHVPGFARWSEQRDLTDVYAEFRRLLRAIRVHRREPERSVQLLKAPQFLEDLDQLLDSFPDARILRMRRDPREVLASSASLVWNQRRIQSDSADPKQIGHEWRRKTELRERRAADTLARRTNVPLLEIEFAQLERDWRSEIRRVYDFLGYPLKDLTIDRMAKIARGSAHRGHRYCPTQFAVDDRGLEASAAGGDGGIRTLGTGIPRTAV